MRRGSSHAGRSSRLVRLERAWAARFGEPPVVTGDAELMARILREYGVPERRR
jgi:hypothetical protein